MSRYIKSVFWLAGCGGAGYILLEVTKPNEEKLKTIRNSANKQLQNEREIKKTLFLQKLQESGQSSAKPIYLKTRAEIEEDNNRNLKITNQ